MAYQGDVEIIHNWRKKHSLDELMRKVEQNGYSAISVGKFHQAVLKKFPYQLTADHCKPVQGYTNTFYIWSGGGSGMVAPATDTGIGGTDPYKVQLAADLIMARRANDKNAAERVIDALGGGEHGILQAFMVLDKDTNGYVTATEWKLDGGGKKNASVNAPLKKLPFNCCALSFLPFETPVFDVNSGAIYDLENIFPYALKHKQDPITGRNMQIKDLKELKLKKSEGNKDFTYECPILGSEFTDSTKICVVKRSGTF